MANIQTIQLGASAEEIVEKINEIIGVVNDIQEVVSYNSLQNKPTINGTTIQGTLTTQNLGINISALQGYESLLRELATKEEMETLAETITNAAIEAAETAVQRQLDEKMDKDPSSTNEVNLMPSDGYVYITTTDGIRKIKFDKLVDNVQYAGEQKSQVQKIVESSGKIRTITGNQDGTNTNFSVTEGYTPGTSMLYFNGQLLTRGVDYIETSNSSFTMLTHIPISTDIMQMVAVPIN